MPHASLSDSDAMLLNLLSEPRTAKPTLPRRDAALDPLLIAAAAASGPHITRNHYHHDFFPGVTLPTSEGSWDWTKFTGQDGKAENKRLAYVSRQAPRRVRLQLGDQLSGKENVQDFEPLKPADNLPQTQKQQQRRASVTASNDSVKKSSPLQVKCMVRTRIPTPHGPVFLHLYHNNRDEKEHLAIVVDPAQLSPDTPSDTIPIRSRSLDAVWSDSESDTDRIIRGAYVGKLTPTSQTPSNPAPSFVKLRMDPDISAPVIRLHSECFTGETVGSMRCDCGEQLDEAIRQISQPISIPSRSSPLPGRGAVIYLRQEGRGIGLLDKLRAYNLQDIGHDTVTANLALGHKADERGYDIACAILQDLGLGAESEGVRVLTNNPDKVKALEKEGITVVERVPMIPRSWQSRSLLTSHEDLTVKTNGAGATLIGAGIVHGEDLDKYLKTKVLKMGHMLPLWMEDAVPR